MAADEEEVGEVDSAVTVDIAGDSCDEVAAEDAVSVAELYCAAGANGAVGENVGEVAIVKPDEPA